MKSVSTYTKLKQKFCLSHCYLDTSGIHSVSSDGISVVQINLLLNSEAQGVLLFDGTLKSISTCTVFKGLNICGDGGLSTCCMYTDVPRHR